MDSLRVELERHIASFRGNIRTYPDYSLVWNTLVLFKKKP